MHEKLLLLFFMFKVWKEILSFKFVNEAQMMMMRNALIQSL